MDKMLSDIAIAMSKEATKVLEENIEIPQSAIIKLPTWNNYTEVEIYACQYYDFFVTATIEDDRITHVQVVSC